MSVNGSLEKTRGGGVCLHVSMHVPPPRVCGVVVEVGVNGRKEGVVTSCNKFNQNPKLTRCGDYRVLKIWRNNQRQQRKKRKLNKAFVRSALLSMLRVQRDKISLSVSLAFHSFSQLHTKTKSLVFLWFFIYLSQLAASPTTRAACAGSCCLYTQIHTHTHTLICKLLHTVWFHSKPEKNVAYICTTCTPQDICANLRITQWATGP